MITARNMERGNKAASELRAKHPDSTVTVMECDLNSLKSVKAFADKFIAERTHLELLMLNAGVTLSYTGVRE